MRLIAVAFLSWLTATIATSAAFAVVHNERPSAEDLLGHGIVTFVTGSVLLLACYLPAVLLLRRRWSGKLSALQAIAATGVIANAPAFLLLAVLSGRTDLFAAGEAWWMAFQFFLFGALFGLGCTRYGQEAA